MIDMTDFSEVNRSGIGKGQAGDAKGVRYFMDSPPLSISILYWAGAVLVALSALIHLHLWLMSYSHIHIIGPLFLVQFIAGFILAIAVAVSRHFLVAVAAALFVAGTITGLLISIEVGLFGFQDSFMAPYARTSLITESVALVVLLAAAIASTLQARKQVSAPR